MELEQGYGYLSPFYSRLSNLRKDCKSEYKVLYKTASKKFQTVSIVDSENMELIRDKYIDKLNVIARTATDSWWYKYTIKRIRHYYNQIKREFQVIDDTIEFHNKWIDEQKQIKDDEEDAMLEQY